MGLSYHRVMVKGMVIWGISVTCYATTSLNVAQDIWPPYVMDTPIGEGIAHDIVTQGLVRAGYKFAYQHKPWARVLKETYYGKNDIIVAIWKSAERERKYHFTEPYLYNHLAVISRAGNDKFDYQGLDSLNGLKVALIDNYAYPSDLLDHPNIEPVPSSDLTTSFRLLLSHRADVVVSDEFVALWTLKEAKLPHGRFHFSTNKLATNSLHAAVRKSHPLSQQIVYSLNYHFRTIDEVKLGELKKKYGLEKIELERP
ncbi:substrate-binding periplasmic protein [Vibrio sinaloensis]|uniref:substrate-binding periplasmic protein n=1 Tax=Photobacterium sp. (strain ATCC 43367) TaxID=379097 RepID=UPI0035E98940